MTELSAFVIEKLSAIDGVTVRTPYDTTKPEYPLITVMQMDNFEIRKYTTLDTKEQVSSIPMQLDIYCRNMQIDGNTVSAADACEYYRIESDKIMQTECGMRRIAAPPIIPHITDSTVMRAISRYGCMIDLKTQTIFKE